MYLVLVGACIVSMKYPTWYGTGATGEATTHATVVATQCESTIQRNLRGDATVHISAAARQLCLHSVQGSEQYLLHLLAKANLEMYSFAVHTISTKLRSTTHGSNSSCHISVARGRWSHRNRQRRVHFPCVLCIIYWLAS